MPIWTDTCSEIFETEAKNLNKTARLFSALAEKYDSGVVLVSSYSPCTK